MKELEANRIYNIEKPLEYPKCILTVYYFEKYNFHA